MTITVLRDPVERIVSHYRFNASAPSTLQDAIHRERLTVVDYFQRLAVPPQYQYFAPNGDAESALERLASEVSWFGLQSDFDQFVATLGRLLGLPTLAHKALNQTPDDAPEVTPGHIEELRSLLRADIDFFQRATELYWQRLARLPAPPSDHPWTRFYS